MQKLNNKPKKILISGSHGATTAMSIIEEIKASKKNWDLYFLGNKWASEDKKSYSLEYNIIPKTGVHFLSVEPGKIENKFTKFTLMALMKIPYEIIQILFYVIKVWPQIVLSLGGASGAITSFWGWFFRIPVIIHEPTATAGRANLLSKKFATVVALSRKTSEEYYSGKKTVITGLPISRIVIDYAKKVNPRIIPRNLLITGGSRGSRWINDALYEILQKLTQKYKIVHQTGINEFPKFAKLNYPNYKVVSQIAHEDMILGIANSDIVVSRAGANTVSELIAMKKPSIFIPIPWSYLNEQYENASYMAKLGSAIILPQKLLTSENLLKSLNEMELNYSSFTSKARRIKSPDIEASQKIVNLLEDFLK